MATPDCAEIEIQVQIEKPRNFLEFLKKSAKFAGKKTQQDTYFVPKHRNFLLERPVSEWLRIRESSGVSSVNYKRWHQDQKGRNLYCDEFETEITKGDQIKKLFAAIGMKPIITVHKIRETWVYQNYEISIDDVKQLGCFVEIEYRGTDPGREAPKIIREMIRFLKRLRCGKITRNYEGYPFQLLFPEEISHVEV